MRVVDEAEFSRVLQDCRGKVVLVDYWATWCLTCREMFPHTVDLANRLRDKGLVTISMSLDDPGAKEAALQFLQSQRATFENFISSHGAGTASMDAFQIEDGLPHLKLYDRSGKLHKAFLAGKFSTADVDRAVDQLLASP